MSTQNPGSGGVGAQIMLALGLALGAALLLAVYLIGSETLRTLGLILVVAIALAVVIGASALPIRAWRRKDFTGDHFHTDGTRTVIKETRVLDGRAPAQTDVKLLQLPAQPQGALYPELLRAAYQAGRISPTSSFAQQQAGGNYDPGAAYTEAALPDVGFAGDEWSGDITMPRP